MPNSGLLHFCCGRDAIIQCYRQKGIAADTISGDFVFGGCRLPGFRYFMPALSIFMLQEGMVWMKNIYILLSRPNSFVSRLIAFFSRAEYSHVSVAYDSELHRLCSFARKYYFPLPGGLVTENENGVLRKPLRNAKCIILSASVPENMFETFCSRIDTMLSNRNRYHYSLRGLFLCGLGIETHREYYYFCSQFVAEMLNCAGVRGMPKPPTLMKPLDFLEIPDLDCVYNGVLCEYLSGASKKIGFRDEGGTEAIKVRSVRGGSS